MVLSHLDEYPSVYLAVRAIGPKVGVPADVVDDMRDEYDFAQARANPYSRRQKRQVTIRLDLETINYFKVLATKTGIPYQSLISLYLADCAAHERELALTWD